MISELTALIETWRNLPEGERLLSCADAADQLSAVLRRWESTEKDEIEKIIEDFLDRLKAAPLRGAYPSQLMMPREYVSVAVATLRADLAALASLCERTRT